MGEPAPEASPEPSESAESERAAKPDYAALAQLLARRLDYAEPSPRVTYGTELGLSQKFRSARAATPPTSSDPPSSDTLDSTPRGMVDGLLHREIVPDASTQTIVP